MRFSVTSKTYLQATLFGALCAVAAYFFIDFLQAPAVLLKAKSGWTLHSGLVAYGEKAALPSRNVSRFESGNIAELRVVGKDKVVMSLRSDNDDALPKFWRQWWYAALPRVSTSRKTDITLKGAGQWNKYLPVYSYDNKNWQHFQESEVTRPDRLTLRIKKKFARSKVWVARFHPYTYSDLMSYQERLRKSRFVSISSIGLSSEGRDMPLWTITNPKRSARHKSRVVIHARTHPGELASSWMLEGMVDYLLSSDSGAQRLRNNLIFEIVPMLNPDGVVAGNNRVTTYGVNLEGKWYAMAKYPMLLDLERVPHEVRLFYRKVRGFLDERAPITMALNLHSSAGEPNDGTFFFPHFGPRARGYGAEEAGLFERQMRFIDAFMTIHGRSWFNMPPREGSRSVVEKNVPESWWWRNFRGKVMALSIESTYGLAGNCGRWMTPRDLKELGTSLAKAVGVYHQLGQFQRSPNGQCR